MKRFLILLFVTMVTITANSQTRLGYFTRNCEYGDAGKEIAYKIGRNGRVLIADDSDDLYHISIPASYVRFSGYFVGNITDPRDNYVNVRKGPGTNYSILKRVYFGETYLYKKTNTNWYKLYTTSKQYLGYIYKDRITEYIPIEYYLN